MNLARKFSVLITLLVILTLLPSTSFAKGTEGKTLDYVALGDSLAAGVTPYNLKDAGYPEYLADRFTQSQYKVDLNNFGVPGLKSSGLLDQLNNPTVLAEVAKADLITLNIGANDVLGLLNESPGAIPTALQNVSINLHTVLRTIDTVNPGAEVYVMGYYNSFPYLPAEQQASLLPLLHTLNTIIESNAILNGDSFVATDKIIAKRYETYLPNPANIHLSLEGYQAVAKEFWKRIDE
ncbi:GDSL-type esterase/lipase family protein [Bacillus pinisoli]|uniref:GDSL-type esterase/lipase family protein n=1 Tax=Bacillus pinisoli TaxID=2901866 RepID=UPI001FF2C953|nr:GDSL-type esterase/lipase family protein [Bacillus pinisoli]